MTSLPLILLCVRKDLMSTSARRVVVHWVIVGLLGVSAFCLGVHLVVFLFFRPKEVRAKLPERDLASLSVAFLVTYLSSMGHAVTTASDSSLCISFTVAEYYGCV